MEKSEIIKLVSEMYKKIPEVKDFLDVFATGDINSLIEKHKFEIEKYVFPSGREMVLRDLEARKLIRKIRKMKIPELSAKLELHYVFCCLKIIEDFGYWDENYYINIESMFNSAVKNISETGDFDNYESQIAELSSKASEYGLDLYY